MVVTSVVMAMMMVVVTSGSRVVLDQNKYQGLVVAIDPHLPTPNLSNQDQILQDLQVITPCPGEYALVQVGTYRSLNLKAFLINVHF